MIHERRARSVDCIFALCFLLPVLFSACKEKGQSPKKNTKKKMSISTQAETQKQPKAKPKPAARAATKRKISFVLDKNFNPGLSSRYKEVVTPGAYLYEDFSFVLGVKVHGNYTRKIKLPGRNLLGDQLRKLKLSVGKNSNLPAFRIPISQGGAKGAKSTNTISVPMASVIRAAIGIIAASDKSSHTKKQLRGLVFGPNDKSPGGKPRALLFSDFGTFHVLGNAGTASEIDLVATTTYGKKRRRKCGTYGSASGVKTTLSIELQDRVAYVYDRRTGRRLAKKVFRASGRCPKTTKLSNTFERYFSAKIGDLKPWLLAQL